MTRLEKYLISTASDIIEAETTVSRYFIVDNLNIRVSDHFSNNSESDIQILIPYNGGTTYIVTIKDSPGKFLSWNAKQIIEFIPALKIMKGLKSSIKVYKPRETTSQKIQQALNNTVSESTLKYDYKVRETRLRQTKLGSKQREVLLKDASPWNQEQLNQLSSMLSQDFGNYKYSSVNEDMKIFLSCTSVTYKEIMNIAMILVDNGKVATIQLLQEAYSLFKSTE